MLSRCAVNNKYLKFKYMYVYKKIIISSFSCLAQIVDKYKIRNVYLEGNETLTVRLGFLKFKVAINIKVKFTGYLPKILSMANTV